ncbi:hypothetical protein DYB34_003475 [Aphanomyces astaci]|uniref:methionine--tRNA ligase n=1 Tax=Aphanomyces astaci TaxID=112090 RepID=A0A418CA32_APHAT|nr:hypothetical protein DYB34_003475 [Aphanomyces astaci]
MPLGVPVAMSADSQYAVDFLVKSSSGLLFGLASKFEWRQFALTGPTLTIVDTSVGKIMHTFNAADVTLRRKAPDSVVYALESRSRPSSRPLEVSSPSVSRVQKFQAALLAAAAASPPTADADLLTSLLGVAMDIVESHAAVPPSESVATSRVSVEQIQLHLAEMQSMYDLQSSCSNMEELYVHLLDLEAAYCHDPTVDSFCHTVHKLHPVQYAQHTQKRAGPTPILNHPIKSLFAKCPHANCSYTFHMTTAYNLHIKGDSMVCALCHRPVNRQVFKLASFIRQTPSFVMPCVLRNQPVTLVLDMPPMPPDGKLSSYMDEVRQRMRKLAPQGSRAGIQALTLQVRAALQSFFSPSNQLDLVQAMLRQLDFVNKVCPNLSYWATPLVLNAAIIRYHKFMHLVRVKGVTLVPTTDIDLVWHTHQSYNPHEYGKFCRQHMNGNVVDHNDMIGGGDLQVAYADTFILWSQVFNEPYSSHAPAYAAYKEGKAASNNPMYSKEATWRKHSRVPSHDCRFVGVNEAFPLHAVLPFATAVLPDPAAKQVVPNDVRVAVIGTPVMDGRVRLPYSHQNFLMGDGGLAAFVYFDMGGIMNCGCDFSVADSQTMDELKKQMAALEVSAQTEEIKLRALEAPRSEKFYITTAIHYTNGQPHMGHAYENVTSDVIARYHRTYGRDVFFLTGTDEHGQKIAQTAEAQGVTPIALCDKYSGIFQKLAKDLNMSNDHFIRTTSKQHIDFAQFIFGKAEANGDIYKGTYEGWYNVREETFVTENEAQLIDYKDPTTGTPLKKMQESSYFFRMSKYQERLIAHYHANPTFLQPETHRQSILKRLEEPLLDLSASRTTFRHGVPLPNDPDHVMYVWFDALSNYLSGIDGINYPNGALSKYWPASVHVIGKDITWFHCVIWPCILMSAGFPLPTRVFAHGFVNARDGTKMSKSIGNVVDPYDMIHKYGVDSFRYFLVRGAKYGSDMPFSEDEFFNIHNAELNDTLGNLVHRGLTLSVKYAHGHVPDVPAIPCFDVLALKTATEEVCSSRVFGFLHTPPTTLPLLSNDFNNLVPGTPIKNVTKDDILFEKSEAELAALASKQATAAAPPPPAAKKAKEDLPLFASCDIRVGTIIKAWHHPDSDKLFCEEIDVGLESGPVQIASGLRPFYSLAEMTGRRCLVLLNIKAAKLGGFKSNGMVLCASSEAHDVVEFVEPPAGAVNGERVFIATESGDPVSEGQMKKQKVWEKMSADLKTDDHRQATYKGQVIQTSAGPVLAKTLTGVHIG